MQVWQCEQLSSTFICHCFSGVRGKKCDELLVASIHLTCDSNPCWNNGTCQNIQNNDFRCQCPEGTSGKNCRTLSTASCLASNPCLHNSICQVRPGTSNGFFCFCVNDWTGQFCETPIGLCDRDEPCFNGGLCKDNRCICKANFIGIRCETYVSPGNGDKFVRVKNKGWYIANLKLTYQVQRQGSQGTKETVVQSGSITAGQDYGFKVPYGVVYDSPFGCTLTVEAVAGVRVMSVRISSDPQCFDVWGGSLTPKWSSVNCFY